MATSDALYGMTWEEIKELLHHRAGYWYLRFRDGQAHSDFVFAGWYGVALALRSYDASHGKHAAFRTYLGHRIDGEMKECHRRWTHRRRFTGSQRWPRVVWRPWKNADGLDRLVERTLIHQAEPFIDRQHAIRETIHSLRGRHAEIFQYLCEGKDTQDLMAIYNVSQGRISQLMGELRAIFAEHL